MNTTKKVFIIGDPHFQISNLKEVDDFIKNPSMLHNTINLNV